jgi:hypothetical protein
VEQQRASGWDFTVSAETANRAVQRQSKGRLGLGREVVAWSGPVWLPVHVFQIALTQLEPGLRKRYRTHRIWNVYEAVSGALFLTSTGLPPTVDVDLTTGAVQPSVPDTTIRTSIEEALKRLADAPHETARQRPLHELEVLGIPAPFKAVEVEESVLAYFPIFLAFLQKDASERIVAVSGQRGTVMPVLCDALTSRTNWVRKSLAT